MFENFMRFTILFFGHLCIVIFLASVLLSLYACPWWSCKGEGAAAGLLPFITFFTVLPAGIFMKCASSIKDSGLILLTFLVVLIPIRFVVTPLFEILNSNDTEGIYLVLMIIFLTIIWTFISVYRKPLMSFEG